LPVLKRDRLIKFLPSRLRYSYIPAPYNACEEQKISSEFILNVADVARDVL